VGDGALSKKSNSRQEVVAWSAFAARGPTDEIRPRPEKHEGPLGAARPGLEAMLRAKAAPGGWLQGRRWRDEAPATSCAHPTRLALAVVVG